jgi:hypothetical protein
VGQSDSAFSAPSEIVVGSHPRHLRAPPAEFSFKLRHSLSKSRSSSCWKRIVSRTNTRPILPSNIKLRYLPQEVACLVFVFFSVFSSFRADGARGCWSDSGAEFGLGLAIRRIQVDSNAQDWAEG